jgi:HEAT repeat protein
MQAPSLTLAAALRDCSSPRAEAKVKAVQNLAPALLGELDRPGPRWKAASEHARGDDVIAALQAALADEDPAVQGLAATGLGMLGEAEVLDRCARWLALTDDDEDAGFLRQCGAIAISLVGAAAPRRHEARAEALKLLRAALASDRPDVRFQAPIGMVEIADAKVERELLDALTREEHGDVRLNLVAALSRLDPAPAATCAALERLLDTEEGNEEVGFEAAMILASARRATARPRLMRALDHRGERDRALEALAVLGPAPPEDLERVQRLAAAMMTPGVTRVRAAYALSRMAPRGVRDPGRALLAKLRFHPRAAVREAVSDALANLGRLETTR